MKLRIAIKIYKKFRLNKRNKLYKKSINRINKCRYPEITKYEAVLKGSKKYLKTGKNKFIKNILINNIIFCKKQLNKFKTKLKNYDRINIIL